MDIGIFIAIAMLLVWAAGTFFSEAPGWLHLLLTVGVFLLVWRIVVRNKAPSKGREKSDAGHANNSNVRSPK